MIIKNKTQQKLVDFILGKEFTSTKNGASLCRNTLCIQKLNWGEQAHALAENNPELFEAKQVTFRMVNLTYKGVMK